MQESKTKRKSIFRKLVSLIKHPFSRKNKPLLHTIEWVFILLAFFAVGLPIIYYQSSRNIFGGGKLNYIGNKEAASLTEAEKKFIGETITEPVVDITGWDTYRNQWYGFEIKHPDSWTDMQFKTATSKNARYETIYKFRKDSSGENDPYVGFDVAIYPTNKVSGFEITNDIQKKGDAPEDTSSCRFSEEMTLGEENNVFQKVSVREGDACFEPTYFFSAIKDNYLYDIIPVVKEGADIPADLEKDANKNFPEYKKAVESLKFIPVARPRIAPGAISRPAIKGRKLSGGKVVGGRIVCAVKNDHPSRSKTKGHHMDEDCCIDPDESRNPMCSY